MEDKNKKVNDIKGQIKSLRQDLKDIQSKCLHDECSIKFDDKGKSLRKICRDCEQIVGYHTEQELKDNGYI